ncbi:MAG: SIR2 family protein [Candidatus Methylomirabilales bacterium]
MNHLVSMNAGECIGRLRTASEQFDKRFAFFLGAGCSVSSGIPDAGTVVESDWLPHLRDIRAPHRKDVDAWAKDEFPHYDPMNPSALYGTLIAQLFPLSAERQREIERQCDGKFPGFGYAVLAKQVALERGIFNVVLTTNFDDLVADALYLFTDTRPLVIQHESLAGYIRSTRTRPIVVKLHGDHRLSPQSTALETAALKREVVEQVGTLLQDRGLVFIGYGGNDHGICKMLAALGPDALPWGVFWLGRKEPEGIIRDWLEVRNAFWVKIDDFDEFMFLVKSAFNFPDPDPSRIENVFRAFRKKQNELSRGPKRCPVQCLKWFIRIAQLRHWQ